MVNERPKGANSPVSGGAVAPGVRSIGVRPCPTCGASVNVNATVCPSCGDPLPSQTKKIRCRRCHKSASSSLVVCPHCGRELRAAPSRLLTWGVPVLVAVLLMGVLATRWNRGNAVNWLQAQVQRVTNFVSGLGERLQPDVSISMVPAGEDASDPLVSQVVQSSGQNQVSLQAAPPPAPAAAAQPAALAAVVQPAAVLTATESLSSRGASSPAGSTAATEAATAVAPTATPAPTQTPAATATAVPTATPKPSPTATSTTAASATLALTGTPGATSTNAVLVINTQATTVTAAAGPTFGATSGITSTTALAALVLPSPTPTFTPAATATPVLELYKVRAGDTLFDIARRYDLTVEDLLAANQLTEGDAFTIQPGDELKIPGPTPVPSDTPSVAATEAPAGQSYTIRAGDTLIAIALRYGVTIEDLLAANNMTIAQSRSLQPADTLLIPVPGAADNMASPTPTTTPTATTTSAPTATPTATPGNVVRLDAPALRSPENNTTVSCNDEQYLTWQAVPSISPTDMYMVHLGYANGLAADGSENVVWVIAQQRPSSSSQWRLDNSLCSLAPPDSGRQWLWYVEVAEKAAAGMEPVSPPSQIWRFAWQ